MNLKVGKVVFTSAGPIRHTELTAKVHNRWYTKNYKNFSVDFLLAFSIYGLFSSVHLHTFVPPRF